MYRFSAASFDETIVFGAARPGYSVEQVKQWLEFMRHQKIQRVCCLLSLKQLNRYLGLLETYEQVFGTDKVCSAPIEDFQLAEAQDLIHIVLPFLAESAQQEERVVVHCSGGIGRTGQVLAAWLVYNRGFSNQLALATVRQTGRNPYEAAIVAPLRGKNPRTIIWALHELLDACRHAGNPSLENGFPYEKI